MTSDWATLRALMIDLDGVVYMGREPIPGAAEFLAEARRRGLPFLLVTNNSTTSPELVAERLKGMHIEVQPAEILTSAQAAVGYVRAHSEGRTRIRVVGEVGLRQAAEAEGLEVVDDGEAAVDWVVAGLDRAFDYAKLTLADARHPGRRALPGDQRRRAAAGRRRRRAAWRGLDRGRHPDRDRGRADRRRQARARPVRARPAAAWAACGRADVAMVGDRLDTDVVGGRARACAASSS